MKAKKRLLQAVRSLSLHEREMVIKVLCISLSTLIKTITILRTIIKFHLQSVAKVLGCSIFYLPGCIGDRLPLPTPKTMLSFIHLTLRLYCNIVWGKRGDCKMKYKVLKSKDSVLERYSIQHSKYFYH